MIVRLHRFVELVLLDMVCLLVKVRTCFLIGAHIIHRIQIVRWDIGAPQFVDSRVHLNEGLDLKGRVG